MGTDSLYTSLHLYFEGNLFAKKVTESTVNRVSYRYQGNMIYYSFGHDNHVGHSPEQNIFITQ